MKIKNLLAIALFIGFLASCSDDEPIVSGEEVSYAADIRPLIDSKCSNPTCHGSGSVILELDTYDKVKLASAKIRNRIFVTRDMPKTGSLTDEQRVLFKDWVDAGAKNN